MHAFDWVVPDTPSHAVSVRVRQDNSGDVDYYDQSFGEFAIEGSALNADLSALSISAGGAQSFTLEAGPAFAGSSFLLLGSTLGTAPGIPLGADVLPLNPDFYLNFVLTHPGAAPLLGGTGRLDDGGAAVAQFAVGAGTLPPGLAGTNLHHAFLVLDPSFAVTFASNPMLLELGS